jgi:hypothetical protein
MLWPEKSSVPRANSMAAFVAKNTGPVRTGRLDFLRSSRCLVARTRALKTRISTRSESASSEGSPS